MVDGYDGKKKRSYNLGIKLHPQMFLDFVIACLREAHPSWNSFELISSHYRINVLQVKANDRGSDNSSDILKIPFLGLGCAL
jgi:hypothetical protein